MVVILGAGITGASTAYYLAQNGVVDITVMDAIGPATCSKAAAFLSESWGDGSKREKLHRAAFPLHLDLARDLGLHSFCEIPAYHKVDIFQAQDLEQTIPWHQLDQEQKQLYQKPGRHALVDPEELVTSLIKEATSKGARLETNSVARIMAQSLVLDDGTMRNLEDEEPVVVAMGPWTSRLEDWLQIPMPIDGVLSTSIVWDHLQLLGEEPSALFCEEDLYGYHLEIFQRYDKSLYISGLGNSKSIKASVFRGPDRPIPGKEVPSRPDAALRSLDKSHLLVATSELSSPDLVRACIRPMSPDGMPIVGNIGNSNIFVASGGGQWGITWGPLLGQLVANMICGKALPLSPLSL